MAASHFARSGFLAGIALGALASLQATPVLAQDGPGAAAGEPSPASGDIVVTARRVEERLQDVPLSVTAFGREELDQRAIERATDLVKLDPALFVPPGTPATRFSPYIRGQSPGAGAAAPESVVIYVAEAPKITPTFYDLANIQVIKGPQGTLFGETATGGVILFGPQRPTSTLGGYLEAQVGNFHYAQAEGALNIPILQDLWSVRVAGQIRKRDGYTRILYSQPVAGKSDADNIDYRAFRVSSLITPANNFSIYTLYEQTRTKSNGTGTTLHAVYNATAFLGSVPNPNPSTPAGAVTSNRFLYFAGYNAPANRSYVSLLQDRLVQQQALGPRAFTANYDLSLRQDTWALINQVEWNITDHITFKNISAISQVNSRGTGFQIDGTDLPIIDSTAQVCVQGISPKDCKTHGPKTWSSETRLNGDLFDGNLNWQAGFYYRKIPGVLSGPSGTVIIASSPTSIPLSAARCLNDYGIPAGTACTELSRTMSETYAGYGQVTYKIIPSVSLTAGYRRTWEYLRTTTVAGTFNTVPFNGQAIPQSVLGTDPLPGSREIVSEVPRQHYDTYTLGADWKIADDLMVYATRRKGHKTGGYNPGFTIGDPLRFYGPESVTDWEVGFKGAVDLGGIRITSDLALFTTDYSNIQRRTSTQVNGTLLVIVANVAKARIRGLEWSANLAASDWFNVSLQYSYLDAKFRDWKDTASCASDLTATGCGGIPNPAALVLTDHVAGTKTANGVTDHFTPDLFGNTPKHRLVVQPALGFGFLSPKLEGITLSATVSYLSSSASTDSNYSLLIPKKDLLQPGRTLVDLRLDWKNVMERDGIKVDLYLSATNVFDKLAISNRATFINLCGCVTDQFTEPRMVFGGARVRF
jgi:iron complex outermembrane receptor protein